LEQVVCVTSAMSVNSHAGLLIFSVYLAIGFISLLIVGEAFNEFSDVLHSIVANRHTENNLVKDIII
jgi:hypothetical protein